MTGAKFDIEKFDGTGDFRLWRVKMRALLIQHQVKAELNKKAHSIVILCLGNKVLREVTGETTAARVWSKLETLNMTKSLAKKLCLKKKLYTFYMPAGRKISEHIDDIIRTLCGYLTLWTESYDFGGRGSHTKFKENQRKSMGKSKSKSRGGRLKCYIFQSEDHLKRNCPKNNHKKSSGYINKDDQPSSNGSIYDGSEVMMVMSVEALLDWIMDLGGSYHMTPRLDLFFDFLECDRGRVLLGDNRECKIRGIGKSSKIKVINGSRVVLSGTRRDNCVYSLDSHAVAGELNASVEEKDSLAQVWHKRLGHISEATLQMLEKQGLFCKKSLESLGGKRYFLSIVDDYSRRVWVYILRFKHEAFENFKEWKQLVENQTGRTVKKLRTDNGLEFCIREFKQLCIESGISRYLTVVETPQQNVLAERMNRTLMDKVRCLLIQSRLPKTFWAEATCTAAYLINRSPSTTIEKKTPMEKWSGHPSDYGMLRTFDCVVYSHVQQGKLEPRAVKCVLLGYPEGVKGYRLYRLDNESPKIVTSRNMVFNESNMYKDTLKDSGACADKSVEELQVEVELQRLNNHTLKEDQTDNNDQTDQEDGDDEDAGDQEINQPSDLTNYQLVWDKEPRTRTKPLSSKWKAAMKEEIDSLRKNKTWKLVDHQAGQKLVTYKWMFKIKEMIEGVQKPRYKARNLKEVIYVRQPPGYKQGNKVCLLKKSLYGLKQPPRQWYRRFDEYMLSSGFKRSSYDICVYYKSYAPGSRGSKVDSWYGDRQGSESQDYKGVTIRVVSKILNNFRIDNGKSVQMPLGGHFKLSLKDYPVRDCDVERMSKVPYANAIGSLMYLMVCTRPDIAYSVSIVSRYLVNPDYAKDPDKGRSITGYAFLVQQCVVSWKEMLQHVVALSTTEAEYMALTEAEAIWLGGLLEELGVELNRVTVNCDNHGAIHLSRNHVFHDKTKHINVRYHFIREVLEAKTVEILKVDTEHNAVDALTKVVPGHKLQHYLELLSVGIG
nr:copia LTR rider [Tanacetum cinerariifolium]